MEKDQEASEGTIEISGGEGPARFVVEVPSFFTTRNQQKAMIGALEIQLGITTGATVSVGDFEQVRHESGGIVRQWTGEIVV